MIMYEPSNWDPKPHHDTSDELEEILFDFDIEMTNNEKNHLERTFNKEHRWPIFYIMAKVHKTPWKTRPVVSTTNSVLFAISKWLDFQLQKLSFLAPGYLRDSFQLKEELENMPNQSENMKLFSMDA